MHLRASLVGSYPRNLEVSKLHRRLLSGKITYEEFDRGIKNNILKLFNYLGKLGINVFTDGMLRWDDIFNPLIQFIDGIEVNGLMRFYDNNFFFRAPKVVGRIRLDDNPLAEWYKEHRELAEDVFGIGNYILKQPLPGPLTLATNSINERYENIEDLLHDYRAEVLEPLIKDLVKMGAKVIELHEPSLVYTKTTRKLIKIDINEISELSKCCNVDLWIITYFGDINRLGSNLSELKHFVVGIDLYGNDHNLRRLVRKYGLERIALGVFNSRNTVIENVRYVAKMVKQLMRCDIEEVYITNNAPMDFIPEIIAKKKLLRMSRVIKYLGVKNNE
jgi:5-methyltetrahydropteroyltriglutamate--homocysteine methyltransferase